MRPLGIRARVLLAAMLPVSLVALLLAIVFMMVAVSDLDAAHRQRTLALARQIASTSEFALFTGNRNALQALAVASKRERDVRAVALLDRTGAVIARAGDVAVGYGLLPTRADEVREITDSTTRLVVQPVVASGLPVETLFEQTVDGRASDAHVLGYAVLDVSRDSFAEGGRALIVAGMLVTLGGLLFGCLLAMRLSRGVTRPILQVTRVVEEYGRGELQARVPAEAGSPLRALEEGINSMAARIERHRDELERRVDEATAELRVKKEEAEHANTAKSRFLAAASHDLRQPIHALRLFVDSLRDELREQPRAQALLERVQSSVDATSAMFDALLDVSRLEAGVMETSVRDFPVRTLLQRLELMFTPLALERGLRYSVVTSRAWVRSDPALLDRVMQNLVSNAMKCTTAGGVVVGCRRRGDRLLLEVWDTGPGIAAEYRQEIFQEFFQIQGAARESGRGLGLGLAIVERICRLLDHPVHLRSTPGRGSVFAVAVPRGAPAADAGVAQQASPAEYRFTGARIAVVDDDPAIRDAMRELLERWGCGVSVSGSAMELLDALEAGDVIPDVLICDYRLRGGASGLDAVAQIREALGVPLPTLLITGDTGPDRLREAHDSGFQLLHKPVAPAKLRQVIHLMLLGRR